MLVPTCNYFLLDSGSSRQKAQLNTIKVDFSKMSFLEGSELPFTQCSLCKGILTTLDDNFDFGQKIQDGKVTWMCRFCKHQNQTQGKLHFSPLQFKYVIEKNLPTKISPPIILFLIDHSGSMGESIIYSGKPDLLQKYKQEVEVKSNSKIYKILKESSIYCREKQRLRQLRAQWGSEITEKESDETVSKLEFLYAVIEHCLKLLRAKNQSSNYRVGFIFFNQYIYVMKAAKQKTIPMFVNKGHKVSDKWPLEKEELNFYNFQQLFQKGKQFNKYFGDSKVSNLDTSKMKVDAIQSEGETAFGPALALALGIVSQHDYGSRIIAVTDSQPNYGILSCEDNSADYKNISSSLQQSKTILNILKWKSFQDNKMQILKQLKVQNFRYQTEFKTFVEQNQEYIKVSQVNLDKLNEVDKIERTMSFLMNLISNRALGNVHQIKLLSDNPKVKFDKFEYDKLDYRILRFLNSASKRWVQAKIDQKALSQKDFLFPTVTQMITVYQDIIRKQKSLFVSCVSHKLIRDHKKQYQLSYVEGVNSGNIQALLDMEQIHKFERIEDWGSRTFRTELRDINIGTNLSTQNLLECSSMQEFIDLRNKIEFDEDNDIEKL